MIMNMTYVVVTLGNKDLTMKEFHIANNIKRAMNMTYVVVTLVINNWCAWCELIIVDKYKKWYCSESCYQEENRRSVFS